MVSTVNTLLRRGSHISVVLPPLVTLIVVILAWQFIPPAVGEPSYLFPTPSVIVGAAADNWGQLWRAVWTTAATALAGLILSALLGIGAAMAMASTKIVEHIFYPYAVVLQTTPIIAIAPLIIIWLGTGTLAIILITFIVAFFPIAANTLVGLLSAGTNYVDLFRVYRASKTRVLLKLRFPSALPYFLTALKISATLSVIGAIIGQYTAGTGGATGGIGYILIVATQQVETPYVFACAIASALIGIVFFLVVSLISSRVLSPWHESAMQRQR